MSGEGPLWDQKSLRVILGKNPAFPELAKDVVCFSNAAGGVLAIGIEDGEFEAPVSQRISLDLMNKVARRIRDLTVNVDFSVTVERSANGGEYLKIHILRSHTVASTAKGQYLMRVGDTCRPLVGAEITRLMTDRPAFGWETLTSQQVLRDAIDPGKAQNLFQALRVSDRVKESVRNKSDDELMDHYALADGGFLTNLGILVIGKQRDRNRLGVAPVVQYIKYDENGRKVNKSVWGDHSLSPVELVEEVWQSVPDFMERYELPEGMFRTTVPAFDEVVIRELLVNALVHRPYTQSGNIFLNLHPDKLEIVNPGPLPIGVTPDNLLNTTLRRNDNLTRLFHDLKLMEGEGSGYDKIYEVLLSQGRPTPIVEEGNDRVAVTIKRSIMHPKVIDFLAEAGEQFQLSQRSRIVLGLLAQEDAMTARDLAIVLNIDIERRPDLSSWLEQVLELGLVKTRGRTRATTYFIPPQLLHDLGYVGETTLKRIEFHRLVALIEEDIRRYPGSRIGEIHKRVGEEIPRSQVSRALKDLRIQNKLRMEGGRRTSVYYVSD